MVSSLVIIVAAIITFSLISFLPLGQVKAADENSDEQAHIKVSSIEEAAEIAGFEVASIDMALIDSDISLSMIDVIQLGIPGETNKELPKVVGQSWEMPDGTEIRLVQLPELDMPNTGEMITIGKLSVEAVLVDGEGVTPNRLALYWQDEGKGYCLTSFLTESVNSELLQSLVGSVATK